eukprot:5070978-Amphidinium_carterae.1
MVLGQWQDIMLGGLLTEDEAWQALCGAAARLVRSRWPWSAVAGPAGALCVTLARLDWSCTSPVLFRTHRGHLLNLSLFGRAYVVMEALEASKRWSDREALYRREGCPEPICWEPAHKFASKHSERALQCYAVAATAAGAQWNAEALNVRGAVDSPLCTMCGAVGTQEHRLLWCPGWRDCRNRLVTTAALEWAWRLSPADRRQVAHLRLPWSLMEEENLLEADLRIKWRPEPGLFAGRVFTDGSAHRPTSAAARVSAWAAVALDETDSIRLAAHARVPHDVMQRQTVHGAELYAAVFVAEHSTEQIEIWSDCAAVVDGINAGADSLAAAGGIAAHLWRRLYDAASGRVRAVKVQAHRRRPPAEAGADAYTAWQGNAIADELAKACAKRDAKTSCERKLLWMGQLVALAAEQGELLALGSREDTDAWREQWAEQPKQFGPWMRKKPVWEPPRWLEALAERAEEWKVQVLADNTAEVRHKGAVPRLQTSEVKLRDVHRIGAGHLLKLYGVEGMEPEGTLIACEQCGAYMQVRIGGLKLDCGTADSRGLAQQKRRILQGKHPLTGIHAGLTLRCIREVTLDMLREWQVAGQEVHAMPICKPCFLV